MKRTLLFILVCFFIGCGKKDDHQQPKLVKKNWTLCNANLYVTNLSDDKYFYYNHFDSNKDTSNLNIVDTSKLPIDVLVKDMKWYFDNRGTFMLNNQKTYSYRSTVGGYTIGQLENGSVRNIDIKKITQKHLYVEIHNAYANIDSTNYRYYTILHFVTYNNQCANFSPILIPDKYDHRGIFGYEKLH